MNTSMNTLRFYQPGSTPIHANTVVYLHNRPIEPHGFHHQIQRLHDLVRSGDGRDTDAAHGIPAAWRQDQRLHNMIGKGLVDGSYKDTTLLVHWLETFNREAQLTEQGIAPLELVLVHAEAQLADIVTELVQRKSRPAGVILSGSIKMLSQVSDHDLVVQETLGLIQYLLREEIPTFGICFGMQLLAYARFGALVERRMLPPAVTTQVCNDDAAGVVHQPVQGGKGQIIFGLHTATRQRAHPAMPLSVVEGMSMNAEYLPYPHAKIPAAHVVATSAKRYLPETTIEGIEILECGPVAIGTQFHPEASPLYTLTVSYLPEFEAALIRDGYDLHRLRAALVARIGQHVSATTVGQAWVTNVMGAQYLQQAQLPLPAVG